MSQQIDITLHLPKKCIWQIERKLKYNCSYYEILLYNIFDCIQGRNIYWSELDKVVCSGKLCRNDDKISASANGDPRLSPPSTLAEKCLGGGRATFFF